MKTFRARIFTLIFGGNHCRWPMLAQMPRRGGHGRRAIFGVLIAVSFPVWSAPENLCPGDGDGTGTADCRPPEVGQFTKYWYEIVNINYPPISPCPGIFFSSESEAVQGAIACVKAIVSSCEVTESGMGGWRDWAPTGIGGYARYQETYGGLLWTGTQAQFCTDSFTYTLHLLRERRVECPQGYIQGSSDPNNACYRPGTPNPNVCGIGNPVDPSSGAKMQTETDYVSAGPSRLSLRRHYRSLGYPNRGGLDPSLGHYWRTDFDRRITLYQGSYGRVAYADRPNGGILQFKNVGSDWQGRSDSPDRLTALIDGGGALTGWRLTTADNEVETYDSAGRLLAIATVDGYQQTLEYASGPAGRLARVTDSYGRRLQFDYDASLMLNGVTLPDGLRVGYAYDGQALSTNPPRLVTVQLADLNQKSYLYNEPDRMLGSSLYNALTGIVDENGERYASFSYFALPGSTVAEARVTEHAGGADKHRLGYGLTNSTPYTQDIDPLGAMRYYNFVSVNGMLKPAGVSQPGGSGCAAAASNLSYDAAGNLLSQTDFAGHKTCYVIDAGRNLETRRVEGLAAGAVCGTALSAPPAPTAANPVRSVWTQWHPDWRLEVKRAEPKKLTTWVYHGQPDPTAGNAPAQCAPAGALLPDGKPIAVLCKKIEQATGDANGSQGFAAAASGAPRIWAWTYNARGQVLSADGPRTDLSDVTQYLYYSDTTADHTEGDLRTITNPMGHVTEFTRYDKNGRPLELKDPNGQITTLSYSPRGWLMTRTVGNRTTNYDYDAVGQLTKVTQADGSWLGYDYDPAHRLIGIHDQSGNRIDYTLDPAGNRVEEKVSDPGGALARKQKRVFDALSRLQNILQPQ